MKPNKTLITYSISMVSSLLLLASCAQKNHYPPAREKQAEYLEEQKEEYDNPTERYVEDKLFFDTENQLNIEP